MSDNREWLNLSADDYHAHPGYGSSAIRCFALDGQLEFYVRYISKEKVVDETDAMRLGRAFHAAMEDRGDWQSLYYEIPTVIADDDICDAINTALSASKSKAQPLKPGAEITKSLPSHRQYFAAHKQRAEEQGRDFIDANEIEVVKQQVQAVYDNPECRDILSHRTGLMSEVACIYKHECGITRKALIDRRIATGIVDFKKSFCSNPFDFVREGRKRGYDYQLGDYLFTTDLDYAALISVNDSFPFEAHAWEMPRALMQTRRDDAERYTLAIAQLMRSAEMDEKDSQGIPLSWHSEGWGARLPFDPNELAMKVGV